MISMYDSGNRVNSFGDFSTTCILQTNEDYGTLCGYSNQCPASRETGRRTIDFEGDKRRLALSVLEPWRQYSYPSLFRLHEDENSCLRRVRFHASRADDHAWLPETVCHRAASATLATCLLDTPSKLFKDEIFIRP